ALRRNRRVIGVVGDIDPARAVELVQGRLGGVAAPEPTPSVPKATPPAERMFHLRHEDREQAHLVLGFMGTTLDAPDRYPLEVLAAILSGQGGRLFLEIRDRQGLAYSVSAIHRPDQDRGFFAFYVATSPENLDRAA